MMFPFKVYYQLFLHDRNGKLVWKSRKRASRSFVIQFLEALYANLSATNYNITRITGAEESWIAGGYMQGNGAVGDINKGIVVGSGSVAPTNTDYALQTQIAHGVGAGQLQYQAQSFNVPVITEGNVDLIASRGFVNGSGATITVREIGLYVDEGVSAMYRMILRDVLPSAVDVPNGQTLTVQYTLRTTV